jgi:ribosomal-protein-alanine N-acetyltransferase
MKIDYKLMALDDINGVFQLSKESFNVPWSLESITDEISNPLAQYIVAEDLSTNNIVGFVGVWIIAGEGNITNIAVHPEYRRSGIGYNLLSKLITLCADLNCNDITLEVRVSNMAAQNLYSKLGFVNEGIRKKYYIDNNEDAVIMWKRDSK